MRMGGIDSCTNSLPAVVVCCAIGYAVGHQQRGVENQSECGV